ncbi:MAG: flippase-like domain-containing protein [Gammaproteobacteria bacterium]|nr:flippase-like domain-containing protein [Gammaproteobacteria bacterium]
MTRLITYIGLAAGLILLIGLIVWQGLLDVWGLLAASGWQLLLLPLIWAPNFLPAGAAWRLFFPAQPRPSLLQSVAGIWMGRAVNNLLPVASIGGEVAKARLAFHWGSAPTAATASVIVDKTVQAIAVIIWGLIGAACLLFLSLDDRLAYLALGGFAVLALCVGGFFLVQRAGMLAFLAHLGENLLRIESLNGVAVSARETDAEIMGIYRRRRPLLTAVVLRVLTLAIQTGEVWLGCLLLGYPIGVLEAVLLKSLTFTLSDIAFIVPNAYGVQEGAFILIGALVGLSSGQALALSLALRIRDLLLDPAGLLALNHIETRRWLG